MSEHIQPERMLAAARDRHVQARLDPTFERVAQRATLGDRVFAKRDFDFWQLGTIESVSGMGFSVLFDDMDEAAVDPTDTAVVHLRQGDFVFVKHGGRLLGGAPARIVKMLHEAAEVEFITLMEEPGLVNTYLLSDLLIYASSVTIPWEKGAQVFAYLPIAFVPFVPLWFPGVVRAVRACACIEIDFADGAQELVPTTLIQALELTPGMSLYTRTEYWTHGTHYYPCQLVEQQGEDLLVQDESGKTFNSHLSMIGILPKGYLMAEGRFIRDPSWADGRLASRSAGADPELAARLKPAP